MTKQKQACDIYNKVMYRAIHEKREADMAKVSSMTKQEKIIEGLCDLFEETGVYAGSHLAKSVLSYLHSQGVVIENKDKAIFHHGYFPLLEPLIEE